MKTPKQLVNQYNKIVCTIPPSQVAEWSRWYVTASHWCCELAKKTGTPTHVVVGVVSALSPGNQWSDNLLDAEHLIDSWQGNTDYTARKIRTYGANVQKALKILNSGAGCVEVAKTLRGKAGHKTESFFWNIRFPDIYSGFVTIDRHMLSVLEEPRIKSGRHYSKCASTVATAASKVGILPQELQAILWCHFLINKKLK